MHRLGQKASPACPGDLISNRDNGPWLEPYNPSSAATSRRPITARGHSLASRLKPGYIAAAVRINRTSRRRPGISLVRSGKAEQKYEYYPLGRFVVIAPGVCGSRPTFKGTRVEVQTILDCLRNGRSVEDISQSYPSVSRAAVREAIGLAARALADHYALKAA
ncbi:MAG: hypothetical protein C5B50_03755 [Verrucomicrobia bacterium]|nr:MAG: hypothetical protein C5B50_03755 [Verrucomicrobiota bacterium]